MQLTEKELDILQIIEDNGRIEVGVLAKMVDLSEVETRGILDRLENQRIIVEYGAIIDWRKVDNFEGVTAMIDVKVTPKRDVGFDEIAKNIYRFPEVKSVYLMSGAYDLSVVVEGRSLSQVANFVSERLATLDSVISTTTHFIMKKYKHDGTIFDQGEDDRRIVVSP
ncbi:Lrp/AsnC family transcriptional regulator [Bacillus tianshenii]|uniref:Lrp/AsnC family transcriptional regulator n=1 Tax=Sutcliffiella tianshenii TaxID=1463404 RepID=UPI001CD2ED56|nr:Lrp/AsnC family transcriptional regulator [Bacillus tianshenii]MCA1321801.1 Lrp/AsnC family transcriptional regulator [Bacillus tianshenii]